MVGFVLSSVGGEAATSLEAATSGSVFKVSLQNQKTFQTSFNFKRARFGELLHLAYYFRA